MWIKQQGKVKEEIPELWRRVDWKWGLSEFDSKASGGLPPLKPLNSVGGRGAAVGMREVMHHSLTLPLRTGFRCSRRVSLQHEMAFL